MGLNLRKRELPTVNFRSNDLPKELADGAECFIAISARAAGPLNVEYMAAMEQVGINAKVNDRKVDRIEDDEANVRAAVEGSKEVGRQMFAAIYDTCVLDWSTNIIDADTGQHLEGDRETFLALAELRGFPEIAEAISKFKQECLEAGRRMQKEDEGTVKN